MAATATAAVTRGAAGGAVLSKTADGPEAVAALRREAEVLERLAGIEGVPRVRALELVEEPGTGTVHARLELDHLGGADLSTRSPLSPHQVVDLGAELATVMAAVHERGVAHGRLTAAHVVLGPTGRASVVGFRQATDATDDAMAADVAALGALLLAELERAPRHAGSRRWPSGGGRAAEREDGVRTRLGAVLAVTGHREPGRRPTMAMLADTLRHERDILPRHRTSTSSGGRTGDRDRVRTGSGLRLGRGALGGVAVVAGLAAAATVYLGGHAPTDASPATPPTPVAAGSGRDPISGDAPTSAVEDLERPAGDPADRLVDGPAPSPPSPPTTTAPSTADPAPTASGPTTASTAATSVQPTNRIVRDGATYELGGPGDVAVVVDAACDGTEQAVLLRPATGELFVFDGWASSDLPRTGRLVTRLPAALTFATTTGRACGALDVILGDGSTVTIEGKELR